MGSSIVVGMLPRASRLAERVRTVALSYGWALQQLDHSGSKKSPPMSCDVIALVVDHVASLDLTWIAEHASKSQTPLIVVAKDKTPQTTAIVLGAGADDYIVYPFASEELIVRIESLVLRARGFVNCLSPAWISVDHRQRVVSDGQRHVSLSEREWTVLITLLSQQGEILSADELACKAELKPLSAPAVVSTISRLRQRLEKAAFDALTIETIHRRGYTVRPYTGMRIFTSTPAILTTPQLNR